VVDVGSTTIAGPASAAPSRRPARSTTAKLVQPLPSNEYASTLRPAATDCELVAEGRRAGTGSTLRSVARSVTSSTGSCIV
jgi:hypothetical protein